MSWTLSWEISAVIVKKDTEESLRKITQLQLFNILVLKTPFYSQASHLE